jgi:hypothetical protein
MALPNKPNAYTGEKGASLDDECLFLESDLPTPK